MSTKEIFDKLFSDSTMINAFINNRQIWKSFQVQIDEILNTLEETKATYDAKILELDDKIKIHDNIFKYKIWTSEEYHEDRHIPVDDFLKLLDMGMVKQAMCGHEFISLKLNNEQYFKGWISKLSSDDYYRIAKAVRLNKKMLVFDNLIISDCYSENENYKYLYLLEKLHITYSNKSITDEKFEICRKTLLLLKDEGLLK